MEAAIENRKSYSVAHIFNICFTLFLMFMFGRVVPSFAGITDVGMNVLGVFLGVIYGYSTCEIAWPSLFAFSAREQLPIMVLVNGLCAGL